MKKKQKKSITLIEIMIVILLIGLIGGALAFNMRGSMDQGRLFKTKQNISRVYDTLMMEYAKGERNLEEIVEARGEILQSCPLFKNGATLLRDGWGQNLHVEIEDDDLTIYSLRANQIENGQQNQTT